MSAHYGIYGEDNPKIIIPDPIADVEIDLPNAMVLKDRPEWVYSVDTSVTNGHKTINRIGSHWVIELIYYLCKAGTLAQQHTKADLLQDLLWNQFDFYYYRHKDEQPYKNGSTTIKFNLIEFNPIALDTPDFKDGLYMKMISKDYVKIVPTRTY